MKARCPMPIDKPYLNIPGTTVFDAAQSRLGFHLNQFCMSLMKSENRERFKTDELSYLAQWPMTEEQRRAVIVRTDNRGRMTTIEAHAPLRELFGYSSAMRSLSQGRAGCSMQPLKYEIAPAAVLKEYELS